MTRIPRQWFRGLLLSVTALLGGGCQDLPVIPAGCDSALTGERCEIGRGRQLRIFIPTQDVRHAIRVYVLDGLHSLPLTRVDVEGGLLLRVAVDKDVGGLRVLEREGWHLRSHRVSVSASQTEVWLQQVRQLWESDKVADAEAQLQKKLATPLAARARAEALGILGRIRSEQHKIAESKQLIDQALRADEEAGLLSNQGKDTLKFAAILGQDEHCVDAAEALLTSKEALFQQTPDLQPWFYLQLATYRKSRGDLQNALTAIEEGRRLAERLGEEGALGALRQSAATILHALGRWQEARAELVGLSDELSGKPCLQANALEMQGWLELTARETRQPGADTRDPLVPLREALRLRRQQCNQLKPIASSLTALARAAILMGQLEDAESFLQQARTTLPAADLGLGQEWSGSLGLIALKRHDSRAAEGHFRELLRLGQINPDKPGVGAASVYDLNDTIWRAHIGLAFALRQARRLAEAEQQFLYAEAYLDRRSVELSLAEGRVSYLGKHEQGTAAYLELLVDAGRFADALKLMRRARARGLRSLLRLTNLARLDDARRQRWDAALDNYRTLRRKLDVNALHLDGPAVSEEKIFIAERRRLELELAAALDTALAVLSEPHEQPPRTPAADEALLACHPLPQGWLCLLVHGAGPVQAIRLPQGIANAFATLFATADDTLRGATRLTVLSYGTEMEQLDFARAPLHGRPLEQTLPVVYGLDLDPAAAPSAGRKKVLLGIDPASDFSDARRPVLTAALRNAADWQVTDLADEHGVATERLLGLLSESELFIYFGHAQAEAQLSRRFLKTAAFGGLQAADVLTLQSVPRQVLLIACESGVAKEGSGGVAGLGLAQAFLLRGSQAVIATTRKVPPQLGKAMAEELTREGLTELVNNPWGRLRAAREAVEAAGPNQPAVLDTSAFRVFVP